MIRRLLPPLFALTLTAALLEAGSYVYLRTARGYDGKRGGAGSELGFQPCHGGFVYRAGSGVTPV